MNTWHEEGMGRNFLVERVDRPRRRALSEEERGLVMEARLEDLENIRRVSIYMILPLILLSFAGGYVIAGFMLRPLDKLNEEIKRKEAKNLNEEIQFNDNGDEISQLIKSFNRMSNRLGKSFESQKQFVENASHELKTPLSIIQANLETALDDGRVSDRELNKLLFNAQKQVKVMDSLTEDLLLLSMISSDVKIEMVDINIGSLIEEVIGDLEGLARKKGIKIKYKKNEKIGMEGNATLLGRAISNVVENGIRYSKGTQIEIIVDKKKEGFNIYVQDNGVGIPSNMVGKIFERFSRLDKGRSRKEGGSGLGLSIARDIVGIHNGFLYVDKEYKKGARFVMEFRSS
jgi:two-component system sensor histidine kinase ArlS